MKRTTKINSAVIFLLAIILLLTGCSRESVQPIDREAAILNAEGLQLLTAKHYDLAIEKLEAAVEKSPGNKAFTTNLAFGYYRAGRFDEAIEQFERAISTDPDDALIYYDYGRCLDKAGYFEQALPQLQKAAELGTDEAKLPNILFELSMCYEALGMLDMSIETIRRAIEKTPRAEYYTKIGDSLQEMGDVEGAEFEYLNAIDISPNYAPAMNNLGLMLSTNDRKDEGMKLFEMVIDRDPFNAPAYNNLALEYWEQGDLESAIDSIKDAIKSEPSNALYHYHYAMFLKDSGQDEKAIEEIQITLQYDPNNPDALAKLQEWQGE